MGSKIRQLQPAETLVVLCLLLFSVGVLIVAVRISGFASFSSPGAFPIFIGIVMIFACVMILRENFHYQAFPSSSKLEEIRIAIKTLFSVNMVVFILSMAAYGYLLEVVGFRISTVLFLWILIVYLKGATPLRAAWITALSVGVVYVVFRYIFLVLLP